jgi:hypothetical protein
MFSKKSKIVYTLFFAGCLLGLRLEAQMPKYNLIPIPVGNIPSSNSGVVPQLINNEGEVAGIWYTADKSQKFVFFYSNGTTVNLGAPLEGGATDNDSYWGNVGGMNDRSQIVGQSTINSLEVSPQTYIINATESFQASSVQPPILGQALPAAINDAAQIVGYVEVTRYTTYPVLVMDWNIYNLEEGNNIAAFATDINDVYGSDGIGQIIGYGYTVDQEGNQGPNEPFLYVNGEMSILTQTVCPESSKGCVFYAINNEGQIIGGIIGSTSGFLYDLNTQEVTQFDFSPVDINDSGWITGITKVNNQYETILWINGATYNLMDTLPSSETQNMRGISIGSINDQGQIACTANYKNKTQVAGILDPVN